LRSTPTMDDKTIRKFHEAETLRRVAFIGVTISTIATLTCVIAVPMLYNYMQHVQSVLQNEVDYCMAHTGNLWDEYARTQGVNDVQPGDGHKAYRQKRHATQQQRPQVQPSARPIRPRSADIEGNFQEQFVRPQQSNNAAGGCCSCGVGPAGALGPPGNDGSHGPDGIPGSDGRPGPDGLENVPANEQEWCFDCPEAPAGPPGSAGSIGQRGIRGSPGEDGQNGAPGQSGPAGPPGSAGRPGQPGQQGASGAPGLLNDIPGQPGQPGNPGPQGLAGSDGQPGRDGQPGQQGYPGPNGDSGAPGRNGQPGGQGLDGADGERGYGGACDHCPPPRTAPGYN